MSRCLTAMSHNQTQMRLQHPVVTKNLKTNHSARFLLCWKVCKAIINAVRFNDSRRGHTNFRFGSCYCVSLQTSHRAGSRYILRRQPSLQDCTFPLVFSTRKRCLSTFCNSEPRKSEVNNFFNERFYALLVLPFNYLKKIVFSNFSVTL